MSEQRKAIAAGDLPEGYDFAVHGYFAAGIGRAFFPHEESVAQLLFAFGIFAVGFLMRPPGGIVVGHAGDRIGRRAAPNLSILAMAVPTFLVGPLPGYATLGLAPILPVVPKISPRRPEPRSVPAPCLLDAPAVRIDPAALLLRRQALTVGVAPIAVLLGAAATHLLLAAVGLLAAPAGLLRTVARLLGLAAALLLLAAPGLLTPVVLHLPALREGGRRGGDGDAADQKGEQRAAVRKAFHGRDLV